MFFAKAREGRNAWWRWLVTIIGTTLILTAGLIPYALLLLQARRPGYQAAPWLTEMYQAGWDLHFILMFLPFTIAFCGFWLFIRLLHKKRLMSLLTGRPQFAWRRSFAGFAVWFAVCCLTFAILPADSYQYQLNPTTFLPLLVLALILIPVQTTFEEVMFRGYLMQGLWLLSKSKIVPLLIVVLIFTTGHFGNPYFTSANFVTGAVSYFFMSLLLGLTAILDDGLEVPCGIHAANNLFLTLVLSSTSRIDATNSMFNVWYTESMKPLPYLDHEQSIMAYNILFYGLGFIILFYAFSWRFSTLTAPVAAPNAELAPQQDEASDAGEAYPGSSMRMPS